MIDGGDQCISMVASYLPAISLVISSISLLANLPLAVPVAVGL
jgi:hypothetical protein